MTYSHRNQSKRKPSMVELQPKRPDLDRYGRRKLQILSRKEIQHCRKRKSRRRHSLRSGEKQLSPGKRLPGHTRVGRDTKTRHAIYRLSRKRGLRVLQSGRKESFYCSRGQNLHTRMQNGLYAGTRRTPGNRKESHAKHHGRRLVLRFNHNNFRERRIRSPAWIMGY